MKFNKEILNACLLKEFEQEGIKCNKPTGSTFTLWNIEETILKKEPLDYEQLAKKLLVKMKEKMEREQYDTPLEIWTTEFDQVIVTKFRGFPHSQYLWGNVIVKITLRVKPERPRPINLEDIPEILHMIGIQ